MACSALYGYTKSFNIHNQSSKLKDQKTQKDQIVFYNQGFFFKKHQLNQLIDPSHLQ